MEKQQTVRTYIHWFTPAMKLISLILLAAAVAFGALAWTTGRSVIPEPVPMDVVDGSAGEYVYVDVIGVSDWVYKVGDSTVYYMLIDRDYYYYVAKIPKSTISKLSAQRSWFDEESEEEIPVRLTGMSKRMNDSVRSGFKEALEINGDDFDAYFGSYMLDVGETPSSSRASVLWALMALCLVIALPILLIALVKNGMEKKSLRRLAERGLMEQAEAELNSPLTESLENDRLRLGSRFLFGKGIGLAAAWDDVRWCYISHSRYYFVLTARQLVIMTADQTPHMLRFRGKQEAEIQELMERFSQYNPELLRGFSMDNQLAYRQSVKS